MPGKTRKCRHCYRRKGSGRISTRLVPVRRSFREGGSASFVRTYFARLTLLRPPHPAPYVREESRNAPLSGDGIRKVLDVIWVGGEAEYFCEEGWTD